MVTYWCTPCAEDAARYRAVIKALALAQGAPAYQAHLTLGTLERAASDLSEVVAALRGLVLEPAGIGETDVFTKSLFVRFEASDTLLAARRQLETLQGFRPGRAFDPHISLCYGAPPEGSAARRDVQDLLSKPVRFDRLIAVNITLPIETYADVMAWTVAETFEI
tara:strand:+ start:222 stop:716 length:495 start_codon:yes stop_codon:yes gene_type:complete